MHGTGLGRTAILRHGESYSCRRRIHCVGAHAPVRPRQLPKEVISGGEFCACLHTLVSVGG